MLAKTGAGGRQPDRTFLLEGFFRPYENADRVGRRCGTPLALLLMLLASALTLSAQTKTSASEVHDHLRKAEDYLRAKDPDSAAQEA